MLRDSKAKKFRFVDVGILALSLPRCSFSDSHLSQVLKLFDRKKGQSLYKLYFVSVCLIFTNTSNFVRDMLKIN